MAGLGNSLPNAIEFERKLDWFSETGRPGPGVFDGLVTALQLRQGFGLHTLNATARQQFEVHNHRNPGVVLHCFLEGSTEAQLAGKPMNLGRRPGEPVKLVLTSTEEIQRFSRRSQPNEYVRKVSIQMSHEWLEENGLVLPARTRPVQRIERPASIGDIQSLEKLAQTPGFSAPAARLQAEAMSLGLVARCFEAMSSPPGAASLTSREHAQLARIEEFARQPSPLPSLQELAVAGGVSQSSLRRLIRTARGRAPLAHVRLLRLEMARSALETERLNVEEAAELAGYSSPANFATAFRRAFGSAPSQVRRPRRP